MKYWSFILLLFLSITSCKESSKERITRLVNEWKDKKIHFPENIIFTRFVTDTVDYRIPESDYKILIYVDSIGCISCKLQLPKWKELISKMDSATGGQVPFLFFFQSKDEKELQYILKRDKFDHPICVDRDNQLNNLNHFPKDMTFQTFLLDKNNKVTVIGNPIHNSAVKDLYFKEVTGNDNPANKIIKTTAEVTNPVADLGSFPKSETQTAVFEIINTGDNPLVIIDITTTCGCAAYHFDKAPAVPGNILRVEVAMTPKDSGFFDETLTIRCNTAKPLKIKIKGNAEAK